MKNSKYFKSLVFFITFTVFSSTLLAQEIDHALGGLTEIFYFGMCLLIIGLVFQTINLFTQNNNLNSFSNVFCIVVILIAMLVQTTNLFMIAALSIFLIVLKYLFKKERKSERTSID